MTVEVATTLAELNELFPEDDQSIDGEPLSEDDDHMRLIKSVLKLAFPGITTNGFSDPVLATEAELNHCTGLLSNLKSQLDAIKLGSIPIGGCIMYSGAFSAIPANFSLADGGGGTPNMTNRFVYGTNTEGQIKVTGGSNDSVNISHNHSADHGHTSLQSSTDGDHGHSVNSYLSGSNSVPYWLNPSSVRNPSIVTSNAGDHGHPVTVANALLTTGTPTAETGTGKNMPPYYTLAWIQRVT